VIVPRITIDIENFRRRVLQDAMTEALPQYWERRARQFDSVHPDESPLPIDVGSPEPSPELKLASDAARTALACRRHAHLLRNSELLDYVIDEIDFVLDEVAA
jgi:hypothetical protein